MDGSRTDQVRRRNGIQLIRVRPREAIELEAIELEAILQLDNSLLFASFHSPGV